MILTVGPGTPAATVDLTVEPKAPTVSRRLQDSSDESSSSSSSSEEDEDDEEEEAPDPSRSRSGSSSASDISTSPKRTLSNRMKPQEEDPSKHAMDLETSSGEEEEQGEVVEEKADIEDAKEERKATTNDETEQAGKNVQGPGDEELMSQSNVEMQQAKTNEAKKADLDNEAHDKKVEPLTDRERFFLETDRAEEHRMQFSEESNEEDNGEDDDESQGPPGGLVETTSEDGEDEIDDEDEEMAEFGDMDAEWFALEQGEDSEEDNSEDDSDDDADARIIIRRRIIERSASPSGRNRNGNNVRTMKPSLRHGGCINTAAWLDSGWRLSTVSSEYYCTSYNANYGDYDMGDSSTIHTMSSDDCPTQLVTSGDDRLVKFWDVRHAMGSSNPLPWGRNTHCPFTYTANCDEADSPGYKHQWREFYQKQQPVEPSQMFGNVLPLATLQTGHRGNVFHVTPMWQQPGKVVTCGADGYLRLGDMEASSGGDTTRSSIVVSPEYTDDADHLMTGLFSLRPGMCFSHHFLNSNVGLLCSERGLRKFDLRLPPGQQERKAVMGRSSALCKACAIWTVSSASSVEEVDSTYVFGKRSCVR